MSNLLKQLSEIEKEAIVEMRTGYTTKELQSKLVEADKSTGLVEKAQKEEQAAKAELGLMKIKLAEMAKNVEEAEKKTQEWQKKAADNLKIADGDSGKTADLMKKIEVLEAQVSAMKEAARKEFEK